MKHLFLFYILFMTNLSLQAQSKSLPPHTENQDSITQAMAKIKAATAEEMKKADIQYFIIKAEQNTYGYAFYIDGKMGHRGREQRAERHRAEMA